VSRGSSQIKTIARNTLYNGVSQAASVVSTLVFLPLIINEFGAGDYGILVLATSLASWALMFDFGVRVALTSKVAESTALENGEEVASAISSGTVIYTVIGIVCSLLLALFGLFGAGLFGLNAEQAALFTTLMLIMAFSQVVFWVGLSHRDALSGLQRYDLTSRVSMGLVLAEIAGAIAVVLLGASPVILAGIRGVALALAGLAYRVLYRRSAVIPPARRAPSISMAKRLLASGAPVFSLQLAQILNRQQTDRLVVGLFLGPTFVTVYEVSAKLASMVSTLVGVLSSALLPVAAKLNAKNHEASLRALFERGSHLITLAAAPIVVALTVIAPSFLVLWGGQGFSASIVPAQLLLGARLLLPLYVVGDSILISKGRFGIWVPGGITLGVANVALSLVLVRYWGVAGVAAATLITAIAESVWYMRVFSPEIRLDGVAWVKHTVVPLYALLVVPLGLAVAGSMTPLAESLLGLTVITAVAVGAYWLLAARFTLSASSRAQLLAAVRLAPRR